MAFTFNQIARSLYIFTALSFFFGLAAYYKKEGLFGDSKTVYDSTSATLVYLCVAFLLASSVVGFLSLFYPYNGLSVPLKVMFYDMSALSVVIFPVLSTFVSVVVLVMPTIIEHEISLEAQKNSSAVVNNVACSSYQLDHLYDGAWLCFDSGLLWLATVLFAHMEREAYFRRGNNNNNDIINGAEIHIAIARN